MLFNSSCVRLLHELLLYVCFATRRCTPVCFDGPLHRIQRQISDNVVILLLMLEDRPEEDLDTVRYFYEENLNNF